MVAQRPLRDRVVLLREQSRWARHVHELLEELLGLGAPPGQQVRLDQPRGAEVESALVAGQAVVPAVGSRYGP